MGALPQRQDDHEPDPLRLVTNESDLSEREETTAHSEPLTLREVQKLTRGTWTSVNKELWLVLTVVAIAAVTNLVGSGYRTILGFYILPTLFSAY
jgi:hypothetical protein